VPVPAADALVAAFHRHARLPVDGWLEALPATLPSRSWSPVHRHLRHHGIGRRPARAGDTPRRAFVA
jgi:hypothetical protein